MPLNPVKGEYLIRLTPILTLIKMVKHIHILLDDEEYKKLDKAKGNQTWHDFIMSAAEAILIGEEDE